MPVYNGEPYLRDAIESILNQTYRHIEFVIINDGSTDNSWEVIKKYAKNDNRIVALTQKNIGLTKSLNKCINMAKGDYIARQDSDDISFINRLEKQLPWLKDNGFDLCCSRTWLIEEEKISPRLGLYLPKPMILCLYNPFVHGTFIFRKEVIIEIGGYDESFLYAQDYSLVTQLYAKGKHVKYLKDCLYKTRITKTRISHKKLFEQQECGKMIRKKWRMDLLTNPILVFKIALRLFSK